MDYSNFEVEDFASDEYFIRWVKKPDQENTAFWDAWLSKNPLYRERIRDAREIVLNLDFKPHSVPEGKFLEVWDKIAKADPHKLPDIPHHSMQRWFGSRRLSWIAAAAVSLIIVFFVMRERPVEMSTAYGESRTISLPDSTRVTLNSNSSISFPPSFNADGSREVFLEGEAFFSVVHTEAHDKFIVRTGELEVEVLGTKFNVNSRRDRTKVIVTEGTVRLNMGEGETKGNLTMTSDEYVEFAQSGELIRKTIDADDYVQWRNNRLIFVGTSLLEIGEMLEDNYGYNVTFSSDSIKRRKFTGSSSSVEIDELFAKLSKIYDLKVTRSGNKVTLSEE